MNEPRTSHVRHATGARRKPRTAMTYGICPICREPRFAYHEQDENGARSGITCPNNHRM